MYKGRVYSNYKLKQGAPSLRAPINEPAIFRHGDQEINHLSINN